MQYRDVSSLSVHLLFHFTFQVAYLHIKQTLQSNRHQVQPLSVVIVPSLSGILFLFPPHIGIV